MSDELNLSIGVSPRFFVRLEGWPSQQIEKIMRATSAISGVTNVEKASQNGLYVDYSDETNDFSVKASIRSMASEIMPGHSFQFA